MGCWGSGLGEPREAAKAPFPPSSTVGEALPGGELGAGCPGRGAGWGAAGLASRGSSGRSGGGGAPRLCRSRYSAELPFKGASALPK